MSSSNGGRLRVGIVGRRGVAFAGGFHALPQAELVALCDIDAERLAQDADKHGIPRRFTRLADMLDHVDAVVIATPMHLHAPQAILALEAGKHVLSEVTACVSLDECWRLADAVQSSGKTYMLSENYCYMRDNVLVRELARKGMFGDVYYGEGEYLHDVKYLHHNPDGSPMWRYYWQVGQNGSTYPTHSLGPVMQWFTAVNLDERIDTVICVGTGRHTDPEHPHDDTNILLCRLRSGRLIRVRVDMMSNRPHHMTYYSLQGTAGVYEGVRTGGGRGHVWFGKNPAPGPTANEHRSWRPLSDFDELLPDHWKNPPPEALKAGHGGGDYFVVRDFVEAALSGAPPPIDVYAGLEWTAAGLCSQISIANGGVPIKVPDFRDPAQRPITLDAPPVIP
jgi:predicted dehydrogenase